MMLRELQSCRKESGQLQICKVTSAICSAASALSRDPHLTPQTRYVHPNYIRVTASPARTTSASGRCLASVPPVSDAETLCQMMGRNMRGREWRAPRMQMLLLGIARTGGATRKRFGLG
jgi:hypothetical protein